MYLLVLLLTSLLLVLGMAFLASQGPENQLSQDLVEATQAYQLARSGIEEARLKLAKDPAFPPRGGQDSQLFTYSESLRDGDTLVGTYRVTVDVALSGAPHFLYALTSSGYTGSPGSPGAQSQIRCWVSTLTLQVVRWDE